MLISIEEEKKSNLLFIHVVCIHARHPSFHTIRVLGYINVLSPVAAMNMQEQFCHQEVAAVAGRGALLRITSALSSSSRLSPF